MKRHSLSSRWALVMRCGLTAIMLAATLALWSTPKLAYAQPARPAVDGNIMVGNEAANSKPAIGYCNGEAYIVWIGTDSHHSLNFGWPLPGNRQAFANKIYLNSTNSNIPDPSGNPAIGPAVTCYDNLSGPGPQ